MPCFLIGKYEIAGFWLECEYPSNEKEAKFLINYKNTCFNHFCKVVLISSSYSDLVLFITN